MQNVEFSSLKNGFISAERGPNFLKKKNIRILGDGSPKIGAHNKPVIFLHPKDFYGTLIELEQE